MLTDDEHNQRLRALVGTQSKGLVPKRDAYDLIAIGGGTAGLVATAGMVMLGARVALVERELLGGDCLVAGCVPSKALLHAARVAHEARTASAWGIATGEVRVDRRAVMTRLRETRSAIAEDDSVQTVAERGVEVIHGQARFTGPDAIDVDGAPLRFKRALIATGARPRMPPIPGLADCAPLTNETLFELAELPASVVVIGGGPIGCEMAQALGRLGTAVTLVQRGPSLLPRDDPEAGRIIADVLTEEGVDVRLNATVAAVRPVATGCAVELDSETLGVERVLVATGRTPNVDGLGLDAAQVEAGPRGIEVNRQFRTSNRRVYAAGDVASGPQFTHAAWAQAEYAVLNAFFPVWLDVAGRVMPHATYTDPEVARVGLSPEEISELGDGVDTFSLPITHNDRARVEGETRGFARVHLRRGSDKILAATIVGRSAGELITQLASAMTRGVGLGKLVSTVVPYPTRSEVVRDLAYEYATRRVTPLVKRLASWWIRL